MSIISRKKLDPNNYLKPVLSSVLGISVLLATGTVFGNGYGGPYGFGAPATDEEIALIDIDVMPDGRGAPPGSGNYEIGKTVYTAKCSACHGADLAGVKDTGASALIGGRDSLASGSPKKTVESYWPYASTVFDYVKRAMPFNVPGSLTDDEAYAVVAYILGEGNILDQGATLDASNIGTVEMPNRDGFIADSRPEVFNYD